MTDSVPSKDQLKLDEPLSPEQLAHIVRWYEDEVEDPQHAARHDCYVVRAFRELQQLKALHAPETRAPHGWQPIDTAPADGTEFIVFHKEAGVCACFRTGPTSPWYCMDGWNTYKNADGTERPGLTSFIEPPERWMSMPTAPLLQQEPAAETPASKADETAWLIEMNLGGICYWKASADARCVGEFDPDPNNALRLSREKDARDLALFLSAKGAIALADVRKIKITQHSWPQLQQETPASEDDCHPFCPTPCPVHGANG